MELVSKKKDEEETNLQAAACFLGCIDNADQVYVMM